MDIVFSDRRPTRLEATLAKEISKAHSTAYALPKIRTLLALRAVNAPPDYFSNMPAGAALAFLKDAMQAFRQRREALPDTSQPGVPPMPPAIPPANDPSRMGEMPKPSPTYGAYDGSLQMFAQAPRDPDMAHLRFLRWLVEQGRLGIPVQGPSTGEYASAK